MKHFTSSGNCPYDIKEYELMSTKKLYVYHHISMIDIEIEPIDINCFKTKPNTLFYKVN